MILRDILRFLTVTLVPLFRSVSLVYNIEIMSFFAVIWLIRRPDNIIKSTKWIKHMGDLNYKRIQKQCL